MNRAYKFATTAFFLLFGLTRTLPAQSTPFLVLPPGALNVAGKPTVTVTTAPNYSPTDANFQAVFQNITTADSSVVNGTYSAVWCVDPFADLATGNPMPSYTLISTYDTNTLNSPPGGGIARSANWGAINWVLNNKPTGASNPTWIVQQVIWKLLTGQFIPDAPGGGYYPAPTPPPGTGVAPLRPLSSGDSAIATFRRKNEGVTSLV